MTLTPVGLRRRDIHVPTSAWVVQPSGELANGEEVSSDDDTSVAQGDRNSSTEKSSKKTKDVSAKVPSSH